MKMLVWFGLVLGALSAAGNVFVTKPEQTVTLECGVNNFRGSLEWRRGDQRIFSVDGKTGFKRKGTIDIVSRSYDRTTNLEVRRVKLEDAGKFTCIADGNTKEHTLLVVSVSTNPSGDLHLGSEVALTCQVSGLDTAPAVHWKGPDGKLNSGSLKSVARSDAGTWKCEFSHGGQTYSESIDIKVTDPPTPPPPPPPPGPSQSSPGSHKTTCPNCTANPPSGASDLLGLKWWVWVAIGVGCLVMILLMVFVICLCKKIKTKKRRLQKMRNSRQFPKKYCQCNRPTAVGKPQQGRRREKPSAPPLQPLLIE
ncbi:T-cell surface glycoprotein CD4 [Larimichthys crocea]|uniref:T-cell surface glycoprotein CD4 n=1 Tax=Larimichthys crocea TaxID=215358 RepID=UPI000F5EDD3A|nr:T-cell surface glycoprotein CD4 [Larimichthys crocea]